MTLVTTPQVWTDAQDDLYCRAAVPTLHECDCLTKNASLRLIMDELALKINSVTEKVAADYYALNDPTFTVVNQPAVDHVNSANFGKNVREHFLSDVGECRHHRSSIPHIIYLTLDLTLDSWSDSCLPPLLRLLPPFTVCRPGVCCGRLEQHVHAACAEEAHHGPRKAGSHLLPQGWRHHPVEQQRPR